MSLIPASCARRDNGRVKLLVVEDEPKLRALLERGLREEGHAVDTAGRGEDALWMAGAACTTRSCST